MGQSADRSVEAHSVCQFVLLLLVLSQSIGHLVTVRLDDQSTFPLLVVGQLEAEFSFPLLIVLEPFLQKLIEIVLSLIFTQTFGSAQLVVPLSDYLFLCPRYLFVYGCLVDGAILLLPFHRSPIELLVSCPYLLFVLIIIFDYSRPYIAASNRHISRHLNQNKF